MCDFIIQVALKYSNQKRLNEITRQPTRNTILGTKNFVITNTVTSSYLIWMSRSLKRLERRDRKVLIDCACPCVGRLFHFVL